MGLLVWLHITCTILTFLYTKAFLRSIQMKAFCLVPNVMSFTTDKVIPLKLFLKRQWALKIFLSILCLLQIYNQINPLFLAKVGGTDAESDNISGCTFIGSALHNLVRDKADTTMPDLILHWGSAAIGKYKNPQLLPGLFPTLWPFGIGGFEDLEQLTHLSLCSQGNYYFDIPDHAFKWHNSFSFIILNILKWHAAHLHSHFTVCRSHFLPIPQDLVNISLKSLLSTAHHLENERYYSDMDDEQHM